MARSDGVSTLPSTNNPVISAFSQRLYSQVVPRAFFVIRESPGNNITRPLVSCVLLYMGLSLEVASVRGSITRRHGGLHRRLVENFILKKSLRLLARLFLTSRSHMRKHMTISALSTRQIRCSSLLWYLQTNYPYRDLG